MINLFLLPEGDAYTKLGLAVVVLILEGLHAVCYRFLQFLHGDHIPLCDHHTFIMIIHYSLSSSSSINDDSSIIRKGLELDWLCPSVLLYLVAVCPPIWILELKMADIRQDYQNYHPDKCYHQYFYLMVISPGEKGCVYFTNLSRAKLVGVKNQPRGFSFFLN